MDVFKNKVIEYLKSDRSFIGGKQLYNELPQKNKVLQNCFSRYQNTYKNISKIHYELVKAVGLTERDLKMYTQKPLIKLKTNESKQVDPVDDNISSDDLLLMFNSSTTSYNDAKALIKSLGIRTSNRKKETLYKALNDARTVLVSSKLNEIPEDVKASIKLRDQFPFLSKSDCPDALKLLVNDLITTYDEFKTNQPKLHELLSPEASKVIVDAVKDNYIANKMAYDELDYYKVNGKVLGVHPLFVRLQLKEEINSMDTPTLMKKINALTVNVSRNKDNPELLERDEDLLSHAKDVLSRR